MRDAISTLEQLAAFSGSDISLEDVEGLLGEVDSALLFEAADLIAARDVAGAFRFVASLTASGVDIPEFVREFVGHVRDLYVVSAVGDASGIVEATSAEAARLTQANAFGPDRLARVLDVLGELTGELRWSPDPRLALEVTLTRLARPQGELTSRRLPSASVRSKPGRLPFVMGTPLTDRSPDSLFPAPVEEPPPLSRFPAPPSESRWTARRPRGCGLPWWQRCGS
jgi:DNA polymerase III subunit gamma/tau